MAEKSKIPIISAKVRNAKDNPRSEGTHILIIASFRNQKFFPFVEFNDGIFEVRAI